MKSLTVKKSFGYRTTIPIYKPMTVSFGSLSTDSLQDIKIAEFTNLKSYKIFEYRDDMYSKSNKVTNKTTWEEIRNAGQYLVKPENMKEKEWISSSIFDVPSEKELHKEAFDNKMDKLLK